GGPPSALIARAFERLEPDPNQRLARLTVEILRPVPVRPVTVIARILRPGRRVALLEGSLRVDGEDYLLARAWRIGRPATPTPVSAARAGSPALPGPPRRRRGRAPSRTDPCGPSRGGRRAGFSPAPGPVPPGCAPGSHLWRGRNQAPSSGP